MRGPFRRRGARGLTPIVVAFALGAGTVGFLSSGGGGGRAPSYGIAETSRPAASTNCDIKGNVSVKNGERIYHLPGQRYYSETRIDSRYGERWLCSEQEARAAGWRRSKV